MTASPHFTPITHSVSILICAFALAASLAAAEPDPATPATPPPATPEPTEAEKKAEFEFLQKIAATLNKGDGTFLHANFNYEKLLKTATSQLQASEAERNAFVDKSLETYNFGRHLALLVNNHDGRMHFIRVRTVDNQRRAIFRMNVDHLLFYFDFVIEKERFDEFKLVDLFEYGDNQLASLDLTRHFRMQMARKDPEVMAKLPQDERTIAEVLPAFQNMYAAFERDDWAEAGRLYRNLPEAARLTRDGMLARLTIAQLSDRKDYRAAIEAFIKAHPDDPVSRLLLVDRGFLKEDYVMALQGLDAAEKWIGGDAELELLRGWAWLHQQKFEAAKDCAMKAVDREKDNRLAYTILVLLAIHDKQLDDALIWLDACKQHCGDALDKELASPLFEEFRNTLEYKNWAATRAK